MRLALFFGLLAFINTCQEDDAVVDPGNCMPLDCIREKIREIASEPVRNPRASVIVIQTKTTYYYYIPAYCCDFPSTLLDAQCNIICNPDGGIAARGTGDCPELANEIERRVYWEDPRQ
jgi:hypothetical protein